MVLAVSVTTKCTSTPSRALNVTIFGSIHLKARHSSVGVVVICFAGAFHGRSYGSLSLTASKPAQRRGYYPLVPGTFHAFDAEMAVTV